MICKDDGIGYSPIITFESTKWFGFQLINSLIEQRNGNISRKLVEKGTYYQLTFQEI
ncbi:MAG: hypothetical protein RQ875_14660 [Vicingaceae bacterium]|nr:hypothetical protein [Vicingaceae bacterium]